MKLQQCSLIKKAHFKLNIGKSLLESKAAFPEIFSSTKNRDNNI